MHKKYVTYKCGNCKKFFKTDTQKFNFSSNVIEVICSHCGVSGPINEAPPIWWNIGTGNVTKWTTPQTVWTPTTTENINYKIPMVSVSGIPSC